MSQLETKFPRLEQTLGSLHCPCERHGANGISRLPNAPNLAGQPEIYLAEQLRNYRSGRRSHEVMSVIAKGLSDADIDDVVAWFASLRVEVKE